jgi:hypothetical protein
MQNLPLFFRHSIYAWFPAYAAPYSEALDQNEFA